MAVSNDEVDRHTMLYIGACGPVTVRAVAGELMVQAPGVDAYNALDHARLSIDRLLAAKKIEVYDDQATGDEVSYW